MPAETVAVKPLEFMALDKLLSNPKEAILTLFLDVSKDPSAMLLVFSNILFIVLALIQNISLSEVLWVYWFQSIIIGFFTILKILMYPKVSNLNSFRASVKVLGKEVTNNEKPASRLDLVLAFCYCYGVAHLIFAVFLGFGLLEQNLEVIFAGSAIFFVTHLISFVLNWSSDSSKNWNGFDLIISPFGRTIPMQLTIVIGGFILFLVGLFFSFFVGWDLAFNFAEFMVILFFTLLKIFFDVYSHNEYHKSA